MQIASGDKERFHLLFISVLLGGIFLFLGYSIWRFTKEKQGLWSGFLQKNSDI